MKRLTKEQRARVVEVYLAHHPARLTGVLVATEIGRSIPLSQSTVLRIVRKARVVRSRGVGQVLRRGKRTKKNVAAVLHVVACGGTLADAAREVGVSWMTARDWLLMARRAA